MEVVVGVWVSIYEVGKSYVARDRVVQKIPKTFINALTFFQLKKKNLTKSRQISNWEVSLYISKIDNFDNNYFS